MGIKSNELSFVFCVLSCVFYTYFKHCMLELSCTTHKPPPDQRSLSPQVFWSREVQNKIWFLQVSFPMVTGQCLVCQYRLTPFLMARLIGQSGGWIPEDAHAPTEVIKGGIGWSRLSLAQALAGTCLCPPFLR